MAKKDECPKICGSAGLAYREDTLTPEVLVRKYASLVLGVCLAHKRMPMTPSGEITAPLGPIRKNCGRSA